MEKIIYQKHLFDKDKKITKKHFSICIKKVSKNNSIMKKNALLLNLFIYLFIYMSMIKVRTNRLTVFYTGEHDVIVTNLSDNTQIQCKKNSIVIVGRNVRVSFITEHFYNDILKNAVFLDYYQIIALKKILSLVYNFNDLDLFKLESESHRIKKIITITINDKIKNAFYELSSADNNHDKILSFVFFCKTSGISDTIFPLILLSAATTFCNKVIDLIESNISQKWTLRLLSEKFNASEIAIRKKLESEGVVFRDLILEIRMKRAITLLVEGNLSISQISAGIGYGNISYFISHFKRFFGVTPKQLHLLLTK